MIEDELTEVSKDASIDASFNIL
jgi:hypothetical protein